ncbi:uncharacterized protein B0I36DRAFT_401580 [Microdochium trichocladiopsis]|uniref:Uncharacterized protein n=1 Tax=Microdochium trichocladiopsis TaxID=1682393 RepID=A0A9P9BHG3_9PEZI|nr:uncharacterized protein B0I36DRAFT_401580 [Microdochium trichocladiopsis]KAH7010696.1 hypothetical protein B0I36DRAFT_401580 [Microdochium trichocladiopsis]
MAENMVYDNGQQCSNPDSHVQAAHIHRSRFATDQLNQDHPSARLQRDGLGTDQPPQSTLAPSSLMTKGRQQSGDPRQTKERTRTPSSLRPLETSIDIKRDRSLPVDAGLAVIKTPKIEPASGHPSMSPLLGIPSLVPSATCLHGTTKERYKRRREDSEHLPDARRRKARRIAFKFPVMVPWDHSYTLKELRCQLDDTTGHIKVMVTWEESVVPLSAFFISKTWQELENHVPRDCLELLLRTAVTGTWVDVNDMGEFMASHLQVGMIK